MAFPIAHDPYIVRVSAVTDSGSPVSGASIKLENLSKGTNTTKVSSETNSNVSINLSECGEWVIGNQIKVTATYGGKTGASTHTTASGDNGRWDADSIAIASAGAATGLRITSTHTPSSSSDTGTAGQFGVDATHLYYCHATNSWKRIAWQVF